MTMIAFYPNTALSPQCVDDGSCALHFPGLIFNSKFLFQNDWNDGLAATSLVKAKGGPVPGYHEMDNYPEHWVSNLEVALKGGKKVSAMR